MACENYEVSSSLPHDICRKCGDYRAAHPKRNPWDKPPVEAQPPAITLDPIPEPVIEPKGIVAFFRKLFS